MALWDETLEAYGRPGVCPANSERQNAMQEARVIQSVMLGGRSELLALSLFRGWDWLQ